MKRVARVSLIIENLEGKVLLLLRDSRSNSIYPNQWTLPGRSVGDDETPEIAACRELEEQTGSQASPSYWKRYDRQNPLFTVDQ